MKELIKTWRETAKKYNEKSNKVKSDFTFERLSAQAETFELCAEQLEKHLAKYPEVVKIVEGIYCQPHFKLMANTDYKYCPECGLRLHYRR